MIDGRCFPFDEPLVSIMAVVVDVVDVIVVVELIDVSDDAFVKGRCLPAACSISRINGRISGRRVVRQNRAKYQAIVHWTSNCPVIAINQDRVEFKYDQRRRTIKHVAHCLNLIVSIADERRSWILID